VYTIESTVSPGGSDPLSSTSPVVLSRLKNGKVRPGVVCILGHQLIVLKELLKINRTWLNADVSNVLTTISNDIAVLITGA